MDGDIHGWRYTQVRNWKSKLKNVTSADLHLHLIPPSDEPRIAIKTFAGKISCGESNILRLYLRTASA